MKKGFTLIELLAVIIILSIIGLVTIPIVTGYVNKTRIETYKTNVQLLMEKTTEYVTKQEENNDYPEEGINIMNVDLNLKKFKFKSGIIKKNEEGQIVAENVYDGEYCANGTKQNLAIERVGSEEECKGVDGSKPKLKIKVIEVTATKAIIVALAQDKESGIKDYKYCIGKECTENIKENKYEFKNLKAGQEYEITVIVRNNKTGENDQYTEEITETTEKVKITTKSIEEPQFKISSNSYAGEKEVTITYPKKEAEYEYGYIIEGNEVKEEKIEQEEVKIKVKENSKITAYIKYGEEEIKNEIIIVGIDNQGPEVYVVMEEKWEKTKQLEVIVKDKGSGIANKAYSYDGGKNWTSNEKRTYTKNQTVKLVVRDKLGNKTSKYKICTDNTLTNCKEVEEIVIEKIDTTAPEANIINILTSTNNVNINYSIKEEQSGLKKITCKYGTEIGKYEEETSTSETNCRFDKLKDNKKYYYEICTEDNIGNKKCIEGNATTKAFTNPSVTMTNTPANLQNGYLKTQVANIEYKSTGINTPTYYVKTTREGVSNINVTESCGTGTVPVECTSITSTKTLGINTWYKVSGNLTITYNKHTTTTAAIYAIVYDGLNYSGATTGIIDKIDRINPTANFSISGTAYGSGYQSGAKVTVTCSDNESGYSTGNKTVTLTNAGTNTVSVTCKDKAGNSKTYSQNYTIYVYSKHATCGYASCATEACGIASTVYKSCQNQACGIASTVYKSCVNSACGVASTVYRSCANSACGVASTVYRSCATSGCGVASYNTCQTSGCGSEYVTGSRCEGKASKACDTYNSCATSACGISSYKSCTTSGCGCKTYKQSGSKCGWNSWVSLGVLYGSNAVSKKSDTYEKDCGIAETKGYGLCTERTAKSCAAAGCKTYKTCANSACGVSSYKTCKNSACGCALYGCYLYKTCANSACGVKSYNTCRNSACGVEYYNYNSCRTAACGVEYYNYNSCRTAACGVDYYNYNSCRTPACGVEYHNYKTCQNSACGYNTCWHT